MSVLEAQPPTMYVSNKNFLMPTTSGQQIVAWNPVNKYEFIQHTVDCNLPIDMEFLPMYLGKKCEEVKEDMLEFAVAGSQFVQLHPIVFNAQEGRMMIGKVLATPPMLAAPGDPLHVHYRFHPMEKAAEYAVCLPHADFNTGYYGMTLPNHHHLFVKLETTEDCHMAVRKLVIFDCTNPTFGYIDHPMRINTPAISHNELAALLLGADPTNLPVGANIFQRAKRTFTQSYNKMLGEYDAYKNKYTKQKNAINNYLKDPAVLHAKEPIAETSPYVATAKAAAAELKVRQPVYESAVKQRHSFGATVKEYIGWMKKLRSKISKRLKHEQARSTKKGKEGVTKIDVGEYQRLKDEITETLKTVVAEERGYKSRLTRVIGAIKGELMTLQMYTKKRLQKIAKPGATTTAAAAEAKEEGEEEIPIPTRTPPPIPKATTVTLPSKTNVKANASLYDGAAMTGDADMVTNNITDGAAATSSDGEDGVATSSSDGEDGMDMATSSSDE